MELTNSILESLREAIGLDKEATDFDTDLLMHVNAGIVKLNQNGVGNLVLVTDASKTWNDLQDITQVEGNKSFQLVPLYLTLSTKVIFDPPPPSTVEYYAKQIEELLWRLKIAYEFANPIVE